MKHNLNILELRIFLKAQEIHHNSQCEARYALDSSSSVVTNHLKERNTIYAISIKKQSNSQQMNILSIFFN